MWILIITGTVVTFVLPWFFGFRGGGGGWLQRDLDLIQQAQAHVDTQGLRIAEHGVDARAVVVAMRPTDEIRDDRFVLGMTLRVTRQDGSTFEVTTEKAVPPALMPRVQPGSVITVKYLPGDETTVALALRLHR